MIRFENWHNAYRCNIVYITKKDTIANKHYLTVLFCRCLLFMCACLYSGLLMAIMLLFLHTDR